MQIGFGSSFVKTMTIVLMAIGFHSFAFAPAADGQDSVQDGSKKKTVEPVFRVSKLSEPKRTIDNNSNARSAAQTNQAQANDQNPVNSVAGNRVANSNVIANNVRSGSINVLPARNLIPAKPVLSALNDNTNVISSPKTKAAPNLVANPVAPTRPPHPLDKAVTLAHDALAEMRTSVYDYTAILAKREQVKGVLGKPSYMDVKIRCPRTLSNGTTTPFSIYMKFLRPQDSAGREVIWANGQHNNNIIAHEPKGTLLGRRRFELNPTGFLAMKGQRYPIYDAGLENLIVKLIEKAERDRAAGPCIVNYRDGANINNRSCSVIELVHNERRAPYEFHKAQVFIDNELKLPVRYAAYDWPRTVGGKPELLEEYTYYNVKVNVGLTDTDFDPNNKAYSYPR